MNQTPSSSPDQMRPMLHRMIDDLPEEELQLVEQVLGRIEMDRLWKDVREGFADDWAAGRYDNLDEVIGEVRAGLKRRAS